MAFSISIFSNNFFLLNESDTISMIDEQVSAYRNVFGCPAEVCISWIPASAGMTKRGIFEGIRAKEESR